MTRNQKDDIKIGLTGGIGSGKTLAARRFAELGAHVFHADEVSRRALDPGAACYGRVVNAFGSSILRSDGSIDRKALAEIVFSDEQKRAILNGIIHPYVIGELFAQAESEYDPLHPSIAIFEVPLLFESGMDQLLDGNILVCSGEESRIRRVMERDGVSREHVLSRMRAQMPEEEKRLRADYILENDGTQEDMNRQVDALYQTLISGEGNA